MHAAQKILSDTHNRQYPLPDGGWQLYQEWHNVLMLHWKVPLEEIIPLLPAGLEPDLCHGEAWVSWLSFTVKNTQIRSLLPLPFSGFNEVNLRTYVTCNGRPGIYMFKIEANKLSAVLLNRLITSIPYTKSRIDSNEGSVKISNKAKAYTTNLNYCYTEAISSKSYLDYWLTERHCLYVLNNNKLCGYNIHHKEWNLNDAIVSVYRLRYKVGGLTIGKHRLEKKHFSKKIRVLVWPKELIST